MSLTSHPKFNIGQKVKVTHPHFGQWEGKVYKIAEVDNNYEYWVTNAPRLMAGVNAPVLAWEFEMRAV